MRSIIGVTIAFGGDCLHFDQRSSKFVKIGFLLLLDLEFGKVDERYVFFYALGEKLNYLYLP